MTTTPQKTFPTINNKYQIQKYLNKGSFGAVYYGINQFTQKPVAIKMEHHQPNQQNQPNNQKHPAVLLHETTILNYLHREGCRQIPPIHWFGKYKDNPCLVMPFYSCSLYDLHKKQTPPLTLPPEKLQDYMRQMVSVLQRIHKAGIIHRDVKPQNWMLDETLSRLVLIDFGMAFVYRNDDGTHFTHHEPPHSQEPFQMVETPPPEQHNRNQAYTTAPNTIEAQPIHQPTEKQSQNNPAVFIGSPLWVSWNVLCGSKPTRRDDFISAGYICLLLNEPSYTFTAENLVELRNQKSWDFLSLTLQQLYSATTKLNPDNTPRQQTQTTQNILQYLQQVYLLGWDETFV